MTLYEALDTLLNVEHAGDWIYNVRDSAVGSYWPPGSKEHWDGPSWEHPRVVRYGEIMQAIKQWLEQNKP